MPRKGGRPARPPHPPRDPRPDTIRVLVQSMPHCSGIERALAPVTLPRMPWEREPERVAQ